MSMNALTLLVISLGQISKRPPLQNGRYSAFELPEKELENAVIFIKNHMETRPFETFSVPIIAEAAAGRRFGKLKELEVSACPNTALTV